MATDYPLVTVAFPLYRSTRFLSIILDNIAAFEYPNLEIIISDRHCFDDAIVQLQDRFKGDSRFRFVAATDQIGWVDHFNELLRMATGNYFCWMFHDDTYPGNYINQLVAYLETHSDRIMAFGRLDGISHDGKQKLPEFCNQPIPTLDGPYHPLREALWMLTMWGIGIPFRGVFRRQPIIEANWYIRPTKGSATADMYWMFGVALLGRFGPVPTCYCQKRYYEGSVHVLWGDGPRQRLEAFRMLQGYLKRSGISKFKVIGGTVILGGWTVMRLIAYAGKTSSNVQLVKTYLKEKIASQLIQG